VVVGHLEGASEFRRMSSETLKTVPLKAVP
jgi:hypothetical protein